MTSAASIAATEKKCRSELPTERRGILHFSLQRLLPRPDSWTSFPPPRSATLLSYRFSLASPFLFYFWLSVSVRSRGSPSTRGPSKDASRFPLQSSPNRCLRLPSQCLLRLLPSCLPLSFFTFILHGITSGDDGIPESKTRSFDFVEILKDVVDLLFSTALQLPRFQTVQPIFPSPPLTLPSLAGLPWGCSFNRSVQIQSEAQKILSSPLSLSSSSSSSPSSSLSPFARVWVT